MFQRIAILDIATAVVTEEERKILFMGKSITGK